MDYMQLPMEVHMYVVVDPTINLPSIALKYLKNLYVKD
jgi:hypothetical protein